MSVRSFTIRGKSFRWRRVPLEKLTDGCVGDCDHPCNPRRTIRVAEHIEGRELLVVTLHEMLHACYWDLDEDAVTEASVDMGRALWRLGWRQATGETGSPP